MDHCSSCGAASNPGATFCHACGATLAPAPVRTYATAAPASLPAMPGAPQTRPIGVTLVGLVTVVFGAVMVLVGLALMLFMGALGAFFGSFLPFDGSGGFGAFFGVLGIIAAFFVFGLAALMIAAGVGALRGREWAWVAILVLMALNAVRGLFGLAQRDAGSLVTLIVSGLVIWYFLRPEVKAWFGKA